MEVRIGDGGSSAGGETERARRRSGPGNRDAWVAGGSMFVGAVVGASAGPGERMGEGASCADAASRGDASGAADAGRIAG